jgi:hypothetical protein
MSAKSFLPLPLLLLVVAQSAFSLATVPNLNALKIDDDIGTAVPVIDGVLDEVVWQQAPVATGFVQRQPDEGHAATERTEARVLYGRDALYIGIRAYDQEPQAIEGKLTRRDQGSHSDWVHVAIDSYNDKRTAFQFGVNPVGVKRDRYRFDDTRSDSDWDAVWEVETSIDDEGWSAEFRIPYSQLRYSTGEIQEWGIQFMRFIARNDESLYWAPLRGDDNAMVSKFGRLEGLRGIEQRPRLEVQPYVLARIQQAPGDEANPFYEESDVFSDLGLDVKYGVTSSLTLDATINPDFGQVEADPAQVNLSQFETFYDERRPFFLEGANIFNFDIGDGDRIFHSRRIGRRPQGYPDAQGGYADLPDNTTIQAAAKLSGKTASGWSIGLMQAFTDEEVAEIVGADGLASAQAIEPASQYSVVRLEKDLREGLSTVGVVATAVQRDEDTAQALAIHNRAYTGGVDFSHRFGDEDFQIDGYLLGSHVAGSQESIARTQRAPGRYMQRPDADHLSYDPTRTSLQGSAAELNFGKISGGFWRYNVRYRMRTAQFETNDLGFLTNTDTQSVMTGVGYDHYLPSTRLRRWNIKWNTSYHQSFGSERTRVRTSVGANLEFNNFWGVWANAGYNVGSWSVNALRGGPALRTDDRYSANAGIHSDGRENITVRFNVGAGQSDSGSTWFNASPNINWRPSSRLRFRLGAFYNKNDNVSQWVTQVGAEDDHHVFANLRQETAGLSIRLDYAFTRDLTVELYARPYVSAGRYDQFKQVVDPRAKNFGDRYAALALDRVEGGGMADFNGDGEQEFVNDPDFNFRQFRSNVVLRWEYSPGSTFYFVWSHGRQQSDRSGEFGFTDGVISLFDEPSDDVVMVKLNYWMNPIGLFGG